MSNSNNITQFKNNSFSEDIRRMDVTQKSNEINENKINRDYLEYNTGDNIYKNPEMINILDNKYKNHNNDEINNDEDFYKNYESIMNYFQKYKEANAKVIENLIMLEENNENNHSFNKNKRKKNIQSLEEFYKKNLEPKQSQNNNSKSKKINNITNNRSFPDKFILNDLSQLQNNNIKFIPFHLIEKKKLLINMMNYLYGKNLFQFKKTFS
jgi:hypothetical protein